ncbi:MAG: uroporphyrinogen decarboxylase family protein, partial [Elusimicrobiota bacterium]
MNQAAKGPFLQACNRQAVRRVPIWLMRQAGRYMKEYRELRAKHSMLEICKSAKLCAEVTLQPIKAFELDAAILFTDLLMPLEAMGADLEYAKGEGPVIH